MTRFPVRYVSLTLAALLPVVMIGDVSGAELWKAGIATQKITPEQSMWMAGYGARTGPATGMLNDLWAKALVLEDPAGRRAVIVTFDLVGIDRDFSESVYQALRGKHGLTRSQIALAVSHTHSGPVVGKNLRTLHYDQISPEFQKLADEYAAKLRGQVVELVGRAVGSLAPSQIRWGQGTSSVAVNRRNNKEPEVPERRAANALVGPVDHDLPVLSISDADGKLRAAMFGYACHATTLDGLQWSSDWPGFAQSEFEKKHSGAVALFWAGCGADQNPLPRRKIELAEQYGRDLATAIDATLSGEMKPLEGRLTTSYCEVALPLGKLPTAEELKSDAESNDKYVSARAKMLLARLGNGKPLEATYPYPTQIWRLGPELIFITLGGEVVVDYALRLKQELGPQHTWVAGYANDVMAYIPSRRVLAEGGYEGGGAMVYYGLPCPWAPEVEETIVRAVREQLGENKP